MSESASLQFQLHFLPVGEILLPTFVQRQVKTRDLTFEVNSCLLPALILLVSEQEQGDSSNIFASILGFVPISSIPLMLVVARLIKKRPPILD